MAFAKQVNAICALYQQTPDLHAQGVRVMSVDEKTGIQALERLLVGRMQPGRPERQESEYVRHGT